MKDKNAVGPISCTTSKEERSVAIRGEANGRCTDLFISLEQLSLPSGSYHRCIYNMEGTKGNVIHP